MGCFDGKVVWITGGNSGIGLACALEFARQGARLALSARREDRLTEAAELCRAAGAECLVVPCDVTDDEAVAAAVATIVRHYGQLDVAMANAGCAVAGRVAQLDAETWRRQLDVNVLGLVSTVRYALPELEKTGGRLALVGSVIAYVHPPKNGAYAASKAAVHAIGQTLSAELARSEVSCTTIHPGFVASDIARVDNDGVFDPERADKRPAQLMWKAEDAARVMVAAIAARKPLFVFTGHGRLAAWLGRFTPGLVRMVLSR